MQPRLISQRIARYGSFPFLLLDLARGQTARNIVKALEKSKIAD